MTLRPYHPLTAIAALAGSLALVAPTARAQAQDTSTNSAAVRPGTFAVDYRTRPRYPFDPQRLKRRPTLDGIIGDTEWDPLYTVSDGPVKGTVYLNWDDDYLYVAARTDQPAWFVFDVDSHADGWLRGSDNLELTVSPPTVDGNVAVSARILDAASSKDAPVWNERAVDTHSIQVVEKYAGGAWNVEMAIPKGIAAIDPRSGATLSCRGDFLPAMAVPSATPAYEPHLLVDVTLVEARTIAIPGLTPRLTIDDTKVIPGQTLRANLELANQAEGDLRVRSVTWRGEASAVDLLRTERDPNVPTVQGLKTLKRRYSAALPDTAVPGFYQLTAIAELDNGKSVQSTASFTVVEPFELKLTSDPDPINVLGPTPIKLFVEIQSAVPGYARGDVEIDAPGGWEVKGKRRKEFYVPREDSTIRSPFYVTLPSGTSAGDYPVSATVYWHGKTWKTHANVKVNRAPSEPSTAKPQPAKP